jgi:tetratricopeptide (TPR) repeat protein
MSTNRDQLDSSTRSSLHNSRGIELADKGWLDEAISEFKNAISVAPHLAQAHDNLGTVYADKGDFIAALTSYTQALTLEPDNSCALHNLGCFLSNHANQLAARCFQRAFKIEPELYESRFNLGLCLAQEEKHDQALAHFEYALSQSGHDPEIRFHLALSLIELGHNVRAIKELRIVTREQEKNDAAWFSLGNCYVQQGFLEEAEMAYTKAIAANSQHVDAVLALASLLKSLKRNKESKLLVRRALRLDKKHSEAIIAYDEYLSPGK